MKGSLHECVACGQRVYQESSTNPDACWLCGGRMHRLGDTTAGARGQ